MMGDPIAAQGTGPSAALTVMPSSADIRVGTAGWSIRRVAMSRFDSAGPSYFATAVRVVVTNPDGSSSLDEWWFSYTASPSSPPP